MEIFLTGYSKNINKCQKHSHNCYEIIIMTDGKCLTTAENNKFYMNENSILIVPPKVYHENEAEGVFSDIFIQTDSLPFNLKKTTLLHDYSGDIGEIAMTLNNLRLKNDNNYITVLRSLMSAISEYISVLLNEKYKYYFTVKLKKRIEENISNTEFNISDTVSDFGYNKDYMRRCFKDDFGITPLEYLIKLRIEYAKELLIKADYRSVNEIAFQCGFKDPYYFSRIFRKITGLSPKNFRNLNT